MFHNQERAFSVIRISTSFHTEVEEARQALQVISRAVAKLKKGDEKINMKFDHIIIRYGEISTKKRNRKLFVAKMKKNILWSLKDIPNCGSNSK